MAITALCCTDGSELALEALRAGLALLAPPDRIVVITVIEPADPTLVFGTGLAAGVMAPDAFDAQERALEEEAKARLDATVEALNLKNAEKQVVRGAPGPAIVDVATELPASVVVLGTRGRGGIRRAVLGSVSDHVVRHAPCPVLTTSFH